MLDQDADMLCVEEIKENLVGTPEECRVKIIELCRSKRLGREKLIPREFKFIESPTDQNGPQRSSDDNANYTNLECDVNCSRPLPSKSARFSQQSFRLLQWNIFADAIASSMCQSNWNGFPPDYLKWSFRQTGIFEHILDLNADIICLQEVDHFYDVFHPVLGKLGYGGYFQPKKNSKCFRNPVHNGPDGIALFYKHRRYDCKGMMSSYLKNADGDESNHPIIISCLEDKVCKKTIIAVTVHCKSKLPFKDLRDAQVKDIIAKVMKLMSNANLTSPSILIAGDFNGHEREPFYESLSSSTHFELTSAYKAQCGYEPRFTKWKFRAKGESKGTLDYIWFSNQTVKPISYLDLPNEEDIPKCRLPNWCYPSNHVSLSCDFRFL